MAIINEYQLFWLFVLIIISEFAFFFWITDFLNSKQYKILVTFLSIQLFIYICVLIFFGNTVLYDDPILDAIIYSICGVGVFIYTVMSFISNYKKKVKQEVDEIVNDLEEGSLLEDTITEIVKDGRGPDLRFLIILKNFPSLLTTK